MVKKKKVSKKNTELANAVKGMMRNTVQAATNVVDKVVRYIKFLPTEILMRLGEDFDNLEIGLRSVKPIVWDEYQGFVKDYHDLLEKYNIDVYGTLYRKRYI